MLYGEKRTIGEAWHGEAEREGVLRPFLVFTGLLFSVILAVALIGAQEAHAQELASGTLAVQKANPVAKARAKAVKQAKKSYPDVKRMLPAQAGQYRKVLVKMGHAETMKRLAGLQGKAGRIALKASLCHEVDARAFSSKKVASVAGWGARVNSYLAGSPMAGTGYLTAQRAYETGIDPRLSPAIAKVESGKGLMPYGCRYNVWGWVWNPPYMASWDDAISKWHGYFKRWFKGEAYPISSMHGYGGYGPWYVNVEMAKI